MNKLANKLLKGSLLVLGFISLQGCITTAVVTSAAVATKVVTDPRTTGTQVDDEILEEKVAYNINKDEQIKQEARINVVAYNGKVLLIGQAPSMDVVENAKNLAAGAEGVTEIYNEIRQGEKIGFGQITQDSWITTQVKSKLLVNGEVKATEVKVVTENGEVFLMGKVSQNQADAAAEAARNVGGVTKVVKVFSYAQ
ncbi:division/outer membrane stress-associated lipid-binding lipoprotein [Mannheimia haemolytica]|uniref:division/outer membrane stress-associated lipid-binding lipoprotein n=1 Tax=Mannheimia haemolytica TaxID=75985 RepID=UPI00038546D1|nr:division/outer membrane stress-associated lipid-binding lipoprotein [Mannheimia haemolytica]EPZ00625.1 outer membrane lipoprotein [Mannheimia haemolytica D35]MDW1149856.1 division/outer membrane stress-associated lipid-binding lipoprotein [Mannheimia haemolytica]MDW1160067.1 division/outer membrane stress-associated lipid-binding lipoprotein [Mannheimia haemolytica]TRC48212.1 divisome-associated lipoprotein YraP [Mannheimia haemolytica]TRC48693.1 divisome-associated lipoprotein YraP [Mannhe